jgi:GT2 family glycosyltransferase
VWQAADVEVLIADNGSRRSETLALYRSISRDPRTRILALPGPFNFSALCNQAATSARGQVLVFLNDDTAAIQADWLTRLADWALHPEYGAIGAKLLYPSGRVQHCGLVIGLGGYAAHIESGASSGDSGYLGRLDVAHEVSAVTGACLAVEKGKFEAVNGFDAEKFPVELGDVDLCLRLEARGWRTILAAEVVLVHHESASRGRTPDREIRYAHEHRHFAARWDARIRDDPFFHPALSLTSLRTRLDG